MNNSLVFNHLFEEGGSFGVEEYVVFLFHNKTKLRSQQADVKGGNTING